MFILPSEVLLVLLLAIIKIVFDVLHIIGFDLVNLIPAFKEL